MRLLGTKTTLAAFRWDLIYLSAQLVSDERPGVSELSPPVQALLAQVAAESTEIDRILGEFAKLPPDSPSASRTKSRSPRPKRC